MNTFGNIFTVQLFGASHAPEIGVIIEGCPAGVPLTVDDFLSALHRRKPLVSGTTARLEDDIPELRRGVSNNYTTGDTIEIAFKNNNTRPQDYDFGGFYRPGHADYTSAVKYGHEKTLSGGGFFSGRTTVALVAAGIVAAKITPGVSYQAFLKEIGGSSDFEAVVSAAVVSGDSLGGIVHCDIFGVPAGLGEPYFDSLESLMSHAMFSIPGIKAISFGDGIRAASMKGSEFNDCYSGDHGKTFTNHAGGIQGGISNGNPISFDVYVRPPSSISKPQISFNSLTGKIEEFSVPGRHDVCFALRLPVVIEMMAACVVADATLRASNKTTS
ncbi:MAG TPA: chorismate synthase [Bacteroidales bacterium]|nr:chorismate synthase [Bacteroidales bacterium]